MIGKSLVQSMNLASPLDVTVRDRLAHLRFASAGVGCGGTRETGVLTWMRSMGRRLGAIALLAMLVRAIIPAGYMLAQADTGSGRYLTVEMCDGHADQAQVIDLDTGKLVDLSKLPKNVKSETETAPCVFAGATAVEAPDAVAELVEFRVSHQVDFAIVRDLRPGRGIAAPPPPSTGPPSLI